jgi:hypothetical protein
MKKEDLIKKAAERGITIDETTAEKYVSLSDEELENINVSGGCEKPPDGSVYIEDKNRAKNCAYYDREHYVTDTCTSCRSCVVVEEFPRVGVYCTNPAPWLTK